MFHSIKSSENNTDTQKIDSQLLRKAIEQKDSDDLKQRLGISIYKDAPKNSATNNNSIINNFLGK